MSCGAMVWPYPCRARNTTSRPARCPNVSAPDGSPYGVRITIRRGRSRADSFASPLPPMIAYMSLPQQTVELVFLDDAHTQLARPIQLATRFCPGKHEVGLLGDRAAYLSTRCFDHRLSFVTAQGRQRTRQYQRLA